MPPTDDRTTKRLQTAASTYRERQGKLEQQRKAAERQFHDVIREAHLSGMTYMKIAEAVGLSYQRIAQIVKGSQ